MQIDAWRCADCGERIMWMRDGGTVSPHPTIDNQLWGPRPCPETEPAMWPCRLRRVLLEVDEADVDWRYLMRFVSPTTQSAIVITHIDAEVVKAW